MAEPVFKGTLLLLQNRTRRDPDSYREEFAAQLEHFDALTKTIASNPQQQANPQYIAVMNYVCHVSHCYPKQVRHVGEVIVRILQTTKGSLDVETRECFVKNLMLLRAKDLIAPETTLPVFFELLQLRDKVLRKMILSHIVGDVRKANLPGTKNGPSINKKVQNFLFKIMEEDDAVQARCAMLVMIDLYRRNVWCDERTVQVLTTSCFSKHTTILRTSLRFFLMQMPKISSIDDSSDDEERDPGREISKMKQKLKIVKKTKYRERVLDRRVKASLRKYNKELKAEEAVAKAYVDPVRLLRDPHQFTELLLNKLQRTSERFEVRILFLNVIARVVCEHQVVVLSLYSFLERYMEPSQLHSTQLLALASMCVHRGVTPEAVEPLVNAIANHFVTDRSTADAITIGINTIREICKRQPLAMNAPLLSDLAEYRNQRGDRGVMMAARSIIQLYREVQPDLLPAKLRSGKNGPTDDAAPIRFGQSSTLYEIPGLELLMQPELPPGDNESSSGSEIHISDSDDDSDDGDWEMESLGSSDEEEDDEDFINVDEECPQLVPARPSQQLPAAQVKASAPAKGKPKSSAVAVATEDDIWLDDDAEEAKPRKAKKEAAGAPPTKKLRAEAAAPAPSSSDEDEDEDDDEEADDEESDEELEEELDEEFSEEDEESDDDEDESSGGWEEVSEASSAEDDEEVEAAKGGKSLAEAMAAHSNEEWYVDADRQSATSSKKSHSAASATSSATSTSSLGAIRLLTDEDFEKIRKLQQQGGSHLSLRGKDKDRQARAERRSKLIHGISSDLQAHDIEQFTVKKRSEDKEEKILKAQELRSAASKFDIRRKKKSKLHSTHGEHSKRGKLFQMTKRSQRVADKLKRSVEERGDRKKDMKKKDIKFRIKRGWKA